MSDFFRKIAHAVSSLTGTPAAFILALGSVLIWASLGEYYEYSNTWQLVINTGTTILTFLMVFLIQNSQNREAKATQLKLDELIHVSKTARNRFIDLEDMSDEELDKLEQEFMKVREEGERRRSKK